MTPLPKKGFWPRPPSYGTFSTPLTCQCSIFPVQKSTTEQTRSSFGGGPKIFGRARSLVRFPPPIRFAPPPYHGPKYRCWASKPAAPFSPGPFCLLLIMAEWLARVMVAIRITSVDWQSHLPPKQTLVLIGSAIAKNNLKHLNQATKMAIFSLISSVFSEFLFIKPQEIQLVKNTPFLQHWVFY